MAQFATDPNGERDDRVRLTIDGAEVKIAESYDVRTSFLAGPGEFSVRLGSGDTAADIMGFARPNKKFQLSIGEVPSMTGVIDGFEAEGSTGGTEVTVFGRDVLATLHDGFVDAETTYIDATYTQLIGKVLNRVTATNGRFLYVDNSTARKLQTGATVATNEQPIADDIIVDNGTRGSTTRTIHARLGEKWLEFVRRHIDRAGLFLTASPDGNFVLSRPNTAQPPMARVVRTRAGTPGDDRSNVIKARWRVDTTHRFTEVAIYTRAGGRKYGRTKSRGHYGDLGMQGYGFDRPLVLRDKTCTSDKQAQFLAQRHIADANRKGIRLEYTVKGHSAISLVDGARVVWAPDTMVDVQDDEFGLSSTFWVESVTFHRPPTTTTIVLMRPEDLVFGGDDNDSTAASGGAHAGAPKPAPAKPADTRDELDILGLRKPFIR